MSLWRLAGAAWHAEQYRLSKAASYLSVTSAITPLLQLRFFHIDVQLGGELRITRKPQRIAFQSLTRHNGELHCVIVDLSAFALC